MDREDWDNFKATKNRETQSRFKTTFPCDKCQDSGVCNMVAKKDQEEYFVRCNCEHGRESFRTEIAMITKNMLDHFEPKRIVALEWKPGEYTYNYLVEKWKTKMKKSELFFADPKSWEFV